MPIAIAIGTEPICSILAGSPVPKNIADADLAGAIRGAPVQLVECETIDLDVPASSEIVIEGYVEPGERALEGEFGEYTGYAAGGRMLRPVVHVTCISHRDNPILTVSNMGKPWDDFGVISSITVSAFLAKELRERGVSFKAVYVPAPVLAVMISGKPQYAGYVHTVASSIWSAKAGLYRPYIFYVGEDVDVTNAEDVFWCLTTRLHPSDGIHVQRDSPSIPLWPFLSPEERKTHLGARVVFDATFPPGWGDEETPGVVDFEHGWPEEARRKALEFWEESIGPQGGGGGSSCGG